MSDTPAFLADGNVLISLAVPDHIHHQAASSWFAAQRPQLATCPITQGTLVRFLIRNRFTAAAAMDVLDSIRRQDWHAFWPDSLDFSKAVLKGVIGHRQVTDAYLTSLAASHDSQVATFDRGLAAFRPNQTFLIPS